THGLPVSRHRSLVDGRAPCLLGVGGSARVRRRTPRGQLRPFRGCDRARARLRRAHLRPRQSALQTLGRRVFAETARRPCDLRGRDGDGAVLGSAVGLVQRRSLRRALLHRGRSDAGGQRSRTRPRARIATWRHWREDRRAPVRVLRRRGARGDRARGKRLHGGWACVRRPFRGRCGPASHPSTLTAVTFEERIQALEASLSPFATRSLETGGREWPEEPCGVRTEFQRDRDRIVHSKPFRRLKGKTQVFIDPDGDHYRTRMTHTLETTAISRVVARALRLNEDLVEAIGLGHDTGHTPFGHAGEEALDEALRERFGGHFLHNQQSLRIARQLNLTHEVCDGILTHTGEREPATHEGKIVRIVDRIAYVNHDIDDALRYGVLTERDLPFDEIELLGATGSERIDTLVHDLVEAS